MTTPKEALEEMTKKAAENPEVLDAEQLTSGACVYQVGSSAFCRYTTRAECARLFGRFFPNESC